MRRSGTWVVEALTNMKIRSLTLSMFAALALGTAGCDDSSNGAITDRDGDGIGDAEDPDDDNDGTPDEEEDATEPEDP